MPTDKPAQPIPSAAEPRGDRIAKLLARAGVASRREVERMIAEGRIALDDVVLDTPATIIRSLAGVTVDGEPVGAPQGARLFIHHKPTGLLVTERDPAGRPTIYDRLPEGLPRLVPVGRLDLNTEGLLLLTTDGGLKRQLELPATGVERAYRARTYGPITQAQLEKLIEGVEIEGIRYGPIDANLERRTGANAWIELVLTEGKNREVRRVLEHLGLQVSRLIRTRYGPFLLGDLAPGEIGEVKQNDLLAFRKLLDGPRRGKVAGEQVTVEVEAQKPARATPPPAPAPRARLPRDGSDRSAPRPARTDERAPERPARRDDRAAAFAPDRATKPRTGPQGFGVGQRRRQQQAAEAQAAPRARRGDDDRSEPRAFTARPRPDKPADRSPPRGPDRSGESPWAAPASHRAAPARGTTSRTRSDEGQARAARAASKHDDGSTPRGDNAPRPTRPTRAGPARGSPTKGPSGGRGHPPRAPKGKR